MLLGDHMYGFHLVSVFGKGGDVCKNLLCLKAAHCFCFGLANVFQRLFVLHICAIKLLVYDHWPCLYVWTCVFDVQRMEARYSATSLCIFRQCAIQELRAMLPQGAKVMKAEDASKNQGWWPFGGGTPKPVKSKLTTQEQRVRLMQWQKIYSRPCADSSCISFTIGNCFSSNWELCEKRTLLPKGSVQILRRNVFLLMLASVFNNALPHGLGNDERCRRVFDVWSQRIQLIKLRSDVSHFAMSVCQSRQFLSLVYWSSLWWPRTLDFTQNRQQTEQREVEKYWTKKTCDFSKNIGNRFRFFADSLCLIWFQSPYFQCSETRSPCDILWLIVPLCRGFLSPQCDTTEAMRWSSPTTTTATCRMSLSTLRCVCVFAVCFIFVSIAMSASFLQSYIHYNYYELALEVYILAVRSPCVV